MLNIDTMIDYCENSIYLSQEQRRHVNKIISEYFQLLQYRLHHLGLDANVYYSGSLARKEPSIAIGSKGDISLESDFDFLIVTPYDFRGVSWLPDITTYLNQQFPKYKNSVVLVNINKLNNIKSLISRDLRLSIHSPIYNTFELTNFKPIKHTFEYMFTVTMHSILVFFLHPFMTNEASNTILYKGVNHYYNKMVLECLRAQYSPLEVIGYYDVYKKRAEPQLCKLLDVPIIEGFIKARELIGHATAPKINIVSLIERSVRAPLGVSSEDCLFTRIEAKGDNQSSLLTLYPAAMLALIVSFGKEGKEKDAWTGLFNRLISQIDVNQLVELNQEEICFMRETKILPDEFGMFLEWDNTPIYHSAIGKHRIRILRKMHKHYIRCKYEVEIGEDVIPDLK